MSATSQFTDMTSPSVDRLFGIVVAVGTAGFLYWFAGYPLLAGATGVCWGGWVALLLRIRREYPAFVTGDGWRDGRWTSAGVLLVCLGSLGVASSSLPVAVELRVALAALVVGAGSAGYMSATLAELERRDADERPSQSTERGLAS